MHVLMTKFKFSHISANYRFYLVGVLNLNHMHTNYYFGRVS